MKIFRAEHDGVYLGGYSVIVALDIGAAKAMLLAELESRKLKADDIQIREISLDEAKVHVLFDGDY